jgi:putative colanic acid biosynthesis acetyltransferase WcaF
MLAAAMPRNPHYRADEHVTAAPGTDAFERPAFSLGNRLLRLLWNVCWLLLYRTSPRPFHAWRALLLRMFGATLGPACHFYPASRIWAPWNLVAEDHVSAGDGAEIYNPAPMRFGSHASVSQGAYLCGATHDYNSADFPLLAYAMEFGAHSWICARACVSPGVRVGEGAVLGLASVATRDLEPWTVYGGSPAIAVRQRDHETVLGRADRKQ